MGQQNKRSTSNNKDVLSLIKNTTVQTMSSPIKGESSINTGQTPDLKISMELLRQ